MKLPEPVVERMLDEYRQGSTFREIADRHGLLYDKVRRTLIAHGVPARRPGPKATFAAEVSDDEVIRLREIGFSFRQIAADLGITLGTAKNRYYRSRDKRARASLATLTEAQMDAMPTGAEVTTGTLGGVSMWERQSDA